MSSKLSRLATKGAPSQHAQSSRKGKKAWRKNVDIADIEVGLEVLREEERVVGAPLHAKTDTELFEVDVKGDDAVRKSKAPKLSLSSLKSYQILRARSAVPAISSRSSSVKVSHKEKMRMLRVGRRSKVSSGIEDLVASRATDMNEVVNGSYDMWDGRKEDNVTKIKPPPSLKPRTQHIPAVSTPHAGTSYNPPVEAHQALLLEAHEKEVERLAEEDKYKGVKEQMLSVRREVANESMDGPVGAEGMTVDSLEDLPEGVGDAVKDELSGKIVKVTKPKTKKQRRKALELMTEKRRRLAEVAARKQMSLITKRNLKSLRKSAPSIAVPKAHEDSTQDLAGTKLGKHTVPKARVDVQLGEELSESLRGLKPEGSLFKDHFESLQRRGKLEPRVRVIPSKRKLRIVDYEKHPWKRFK